MIDTLSFGGTKWLRDQIGLSHWVDTTSWAYIGGMVTGVGVQIAIGFYTGGTCSVGSLVTAAKIYNGIGIGVGLFHTYQNYQNGTLSWVDALNVLPVVAWGIGKAGRILGKRGCFEAGTLVADGATYASQYVVAGSASSRWYWTMTVGLLGTAVLVSGTRCRREEKQKRTALDRLFDQLHDDAPEPWPESEEIDCLAQDVAEATSDRTETAADRVLTWGDIAFEQPGGTCALLDSPSAKPTMERSLHVQPVTEPDSAFSPMSTSARDKTESRSSSRRGSWWRWPLIASLILFSGYFGSLAIQSPKATETAQPANTAPGVVVDGVRYRSIETYRPCDRVLGRNPELTDTDRADFGPEPDPATWKLLTLRAPKHDGSTADVQMVQGPEWLAEHRPEVGATVPISVPECSIEGMAEVLSIGACPPVKPGPGPVVLATFKHYVGSTVDVYVTGLSEPIGCTGNHPFWSNDRQEFVRADKLRPGENLDGFGTGAHVERVVTIGEPKLVYNIQVQGEHVYRVSKSGLLVHNARLCKIKFHKVGDDFAKKGFHISVAKHKYEIRIVAERGQLAFRELPGSPVTRETEAAISAMIRRGFTQRETRKLLRDAIRARQHLQSNPNLERAAEAIEELTEIIAVLEAL